MLKSKDLLGIGYFPREMIPPFNSEGLRTHYDAIKLKCDIYNYKGNGKSIGFSIPRLKSSRRRLAIPNPYFQFKLCEVIEDNWSDINLILKNNSNSLSLPVVNRDKRALSKKYSYSEISNKKILLSVSNKYMVYADISRYHNTIYTHSIPWAIHGKTTAKKDKSSALYGNEIDRFIRSSQDGQTIGIPTGPDTSHLISEIIASRIDDELNKVLDKSIEKFRYVDDFYFFCKSLSEAELIISQLTKILAQFELEINPEKTKIFSIPLEIEPSWVSNLRQYEFSRSSVKQRAELTNYFSMVFKFANEYNHDFVMKYAIARIKNFQFHKENWDIFQSLLLQSLQAEPSVFETVLEMFLKYEQIGYEIGRNLVKKTLYYLFDENIVHNNSFEILWSLWMARSLKISINKAYSKKLVALDDPLVALVIKDMQFEKLISNNINTNIWKNHENYDSLFSEHWIFAYESYVDGKVSNTDKYINRSTFYKALETVGVRFYDKTRQIEIEPFEEFNDQINDKIIEIVNELKESVEKLSNTQASKDQITKVEKMLENLNKLNNQIGTTYKYL